MHSRFGASSYRRVVAEGHGCRIADTDGHSYLDAHAAEGSLTLGYGSVEMADAIADQMLTLEHFTNGGTLSTPPVVDLAERVTTRAPAGITKVSFVSGSSEACDEAVRLAREYHHRLGQPDRYWILSVTGGDYGRTLVGAALDGAVCSGVGPLLVGFAQVAPPVVTEETDENDAVESSLVALLAEIERIGADRVAALFVDPALSGNGLTFLPVRWWTAVAEILNSHGILLVLNESHTAFGRTGRWFAAEHYAVSPDLLIVADALTGGYLPLAALLYSDRAATVLAGFDGGGSYGGHTTACAAGRTAIDLIERDHLVERAERLGTFMLTSLRGLTELSIVRAVRGLGLMIGIELEGVDAGGVADVLRTEHSLLVGVSGSCLTITPPLVIDDADAERIVAALTEALHGCADNLIGGRP